MGLSVADLTHPYYEERFRDWIKWRYTYEGGRRFIDRYLKKFSKRETRDMFELRKNVSYNPAFAKEAVDEIKNSIFQRLVDISRAGGSKSYIDAVNGLDGGIDTLGSSMPIFIARKVLPELLTMSRVGIYVDMPRISGVTLANEVNEKRPYVYIYKAEDIRSWTYDDRSTTNEFTNVLLREYYYTYDEDTGLPTGQESRFRRLWIEDGRVHLQFFNATGEVINQEAFDTSDREIILDIDRIPFIVTELSDSLLAEAANYQIALLNLASSDMAYALQSNFPFYTEQYEPRASSEFTRRPGGDQGGQGTDASAGKVDEVRVGTSQGRRYPIGTDRPGFIHPSSEPLKASMAKQDQLKAEIRQLVQLAVVNLSADAKNASAESKAYDQQGLESGLSYIGLELENMERKIAAYWNMYEKKGQATVNYPQTYNLKSDGQRMSEAESLDKLINCVPSKIFQKSVAKRIADLLVGRRISVQEYQNMMTEIEKAKGITADPEVVAKDVETGIVDLATASELRGYPTGSVDKAAKDHADRLARIAESQTPNNDMVNGAARGTPDLGTPGDGAKEKASSKDTTKDPVVKDKVRGNGK